MATSSGAVVFCPDCGRILDSPAAGASSSKCRGCNRACEWELFVGKTTTTASRPKFNVTALLQEVDKDLDVRAKVEEQCPKCKHKFALFQTLQLRSVDEGQTIFYECMGCAHVWSVNA